MAVLGVQHVIEVLMLKILTLSWEGKSKLENLYPTLIKSLNGVQYEWFIKDNGSKDNSIELEKIWENDKIHIIPYPHNRDNFSQGCNFLVKESGATTQDQLLFLNNDITFQDIVSIGGMLSILKKDPKVGAVGTRLLYANSSQKLQHAGVVFDNIYQTPMNFRSGQLDDENSRKNRQFQAVTGAVFLVSFNIFEKAGRFDENFIWAFDDIDLSLSIKHNLGKKIVYYGKSQIFHEESASLKKNPVNKIFLGHNLNYFFKKWKGRYQIDRDIYARDPNYNLYEEK
jgi:GT2 family glycosyltransferase